MGKHLDLDDCAALSPVAQAELASLRAEVEALRAAMTKALQRAKVFDDGSDGADGESAAKLLLWTVRDPSLESVTWARSDIDWTRDDITWSTP